MMLEIVTCGISLNIDGTQDSEINCIKEGGVATEVDGVIAQKTRALLIENDEVEDPFSDTEDEDELEQNETKVYDS